MECLGFPSTRERREGNKLEFFKNECTGAFYERKDAFDGNDGRYPD